MQIWDKVQHTVIALACLGIGIAIDQPIAGAAAGVALFVGREHAAAVWNLRFNEGWMKEPRVKTEAEALKFWKWRPDNFFDVAIPSAVTVLACIIYVGGIR